MRVDIGDGVRLFVDVVGSALRPDDDAMVAKPSLIVLHGGPGSDHSSFRPYMDRFADTHQVLFVDHRGNGRSDGWDDPSAWNLDTWADDVVRLCDVLGVERPVVLGLSFGGFVALRYGARHPDHAAGIVLASTKARTHTDESAERFRELGGERAEATYRRIYDDRDVSADAWVDYVMVNMPLYNPTPSTFGPGRSIMNLELLVDFTSKEHVDMDLRDDARRFAVPTLLLAGSVDPMTPPSCSYEIAEELPPGLGTVEVIDGAGHGTFRDRPEESEAVLRSFLADERVVARQA